MRTQLGFSWQAFARVLAGKDMVGALGAEVDRLESEIKRVMPGIRHIDLVRNLCDANVNVQVLLINLSHPEIFVYIRQLLQ